MFGIFTMMYDIQDYLAFGLRSSSGVSKYKNENMPFREVNISLLG
jgi:hypothetical protein